MEKEYYMGMALELAKKGMGYTSPNPMVGAVIVKDDVVIAEGWHHKYGELHAERDALRNCEADTKGATMYVTLEPCCHYGKQPPCTEAIIEAGISKVVVGSLDPNPLVAGQGIEILREHGIEVITGVLEEECNKLNEVFMHYMTENTPFIAMKYAMTMDGKIATWTGESKWITNEKSREMVQHLRHKYSGIMVGIGTVIADDPMLNCRIPGGKNPIRIICDSQLRTPLNSQIVQTAKEIPTIIGTCSSDENQRKLFEEAGCKVIKVGCVKGHMNLVELFEKLYEEKIDSILVEGGGRLNWSVMETGKINKVYTFIAPKIFGGKDALSPIEGQGVDHPSECLKLVNSKITQIEQDFFIESEVDRNVYRNS